MLTSFLTPEFLSLIGGSLVGFLFRVSAERREIEKERFNRMMEAIKVSDESHNQAVQRVSVDAGKVVRRSIVLTVLFGTIIVPFILPFFDIDTVVQSVSTHESIFWGLFGTTTEDSYTPVRGFLYSDELAQVLVTVVGFYFGNAAAAKKT
jgi:hypothetical protein